MCRSVRIERIDNRGIRSVKSVLRSVNRISLVGLRIFSWQEWLYTVCRSVRIERIDKRGIRSVRSVLRSVNRISLVGLEIFSWQEWLYTVGRSVRIERIDKKRNITVGVHLSWFLRLCWFMVYRTRNNITLGVRISWFLRLCWFIVIERGILYLGCAFLGFCACVGLWFIERGILQLECASLALRIAGIERTVSHFALM